MKKTGFTAILTAAALLLTSCSRTEEVAYDPTPNESTTATVSATEAETTTAETTAEETAEETTATAETTTEAATAATTAETTVTTTTTAATTTTAVTTWTEQAVNKVMYVNTNGIYSRKYAIQGSTTVKQYKLNDKVTVVALTNTDYYKLNDGSFIHKDYLSSSEIVITTTTTTAAAAAPTSVEKLLNSAPLKPMKTNDPEIDSWVTDTLGKITNKNMSTYQKVKAVYDYIIENFSYYATWGMGSMTSYESRYDKHLVTKASGMLYWQGGVCHDYSALFVVMTRAIGLETYTVSGWVRKKSGGQTGHEWVFIKLNGQYYTFDPQVEQNNLVNGQNQYWFFCRSEASGADLYKYEIVAYIEECAIAEGIDINGLDVRDCVMKMFNNFKTV